MPTYIQLGYRLRNYGLEVDGPQVYLTRIALEYGFDDRQIDVGQDVEGGQEEN
jgi:hypothetical protein